MAVILISGGTGLIGRALAMALIDKGHVIRVLTRSPKTDSIIQYFYWNVDKQEIDEQAFEGVDHVVHLAGEGIAEKRWTRSQKKKIIDSRVQSMHLIEKALLKKKTVLKSFVGASAIGIYGMQTSEIIFGENDKGKKDFLSEVCHLWEQAYTTADQFSKRTCIIRTGVVLSPKGGALGKMLPIFNLGFGSAIGSGKQYMPWIHIQDIVRVYVEALFNPNFSGVYNAVSSEHIDNFHFCRSLAKSRHKPFFMPKVPAFVLKLVYGEMAEMLLSGSRISNRRLLDTEFRFKFDGLNKALENLTNLK